MGGRVTAAVFMLAGIGVVSFITANIAAFFVESDQELDPADRLRILEQGQERLGIFVETDTGTPKPHGPKLGNRFNTRELGSEMTCPEVDPRTRLVEGMHA